MSRFPVAVALTLAGLVVTAAGCGHSGGHATATLTAASRTTVAPCRLDGVQRRAVARALADIRRLRHIQAPMHAFSQRGAPHQEQVTGQLLLDIGSGHLPRNVYSHLLHMAKTAASLCGECTQGLETSEPFLGNRSHERCD